jgi:hypothetical protein
MHGGSPIHVLLLRAPSPKTSESLAVVARDAAAGGLVAEIFEDSSIASSVSKIVLNLL